MTTQFLTDEQGQKVAVAIPIGDYKELMEDTPQIES